MKDLPFIDLPMPKLLKPGTGQHLANQVVRSAKEKKLLPTTANCMGCGKETSGQSLQCHHDDYALPCRVNLLCIRCHRYRHLELGWGAGAFKGPVTDGLTNKQRHRNRLKASKKCTRCGNLATKGRVTCAACRADRNQRRNHQTAA